jgi:hypothetical protein
MQDTRADLRESEVSLEKNAAAAIRLARQSVSRKSVTQGNFPLNFTADAV